MKILQKPTQRIRQRINHWFAIWQKQYPEFSYDAPVITWLNQVVLAGKLLRGGLAIAWYQALTNRIAPVGLVDMAAAIELAETGLLIHDDLIDQDDLRRGLSSTHAQFSALAAEQNWRQPATFGLAAGLCSGDILFFWLWEVLNLAKLPEGVKSKLRSLASYELAKVGFAEVQDVVLSLRPESASRSEIERLHQRKTGRYTFVWPLQSGSLVAGVSAARVKSLENLGEQLGVLYQFVDDRLGLLGDWQLTGKGIRSDIAQAKQTLYTQYLYQLATPAESRRLQTIIGNPQVSETELQWLQGLIVDRGIDKRIAQDIENQAQIIREIIVSPGLRWLPPKAKALAEGLVEYLLARQA